MRSTTLAATCALLLLAAVASTSASASVDPLPASAIPWTASSIPIARLLSFVSRQYEVVYEQWLADPSSYPNYGVPSDSKWHTLSSKQPTFTNGYFPGRFFYLYEHSGNRTLLQHGINTTYPLASVANQTSTHDVGFVIMASFGHLYRLSPTPATLATITRAAHSLATRYSPVVRCTRSWDSSAGFEVIIDNSMNLELLWFAGLAGNATYTHMAFNHANRTMHEHVRPDGSTYHVVNYSATTGEVSNKYSAQGYAAWSTWSRGQAWCVYGYTVSYRYSAHRPFLDTAVRAAEYFIARLGETADSVPYWDFAAPYNATYQPRDTSAAAVLVSALAELSQYVSAAQRDRYYAVIARVMQGLVGEQSEYYVGNRLHGAGEVRLPAVLVNATTGPWRDGFASTAPYNVAESYADYYLTEALVRLSAIQQGKPLPVLTPESLKQGRHVSRKRAVA